VRRQALELSPARFEFDTGRLLKVLDDSLAEAQAQRELQAQAQRELQAQAQREAEAQPASARRAAPGVGGAAPRQVAERQPAAAPSTPRWRGSGQVPLPRRRRLLLGAGAAAMALAVVAFSTPS
jgi:hypothetical protein